MILISSSLESLLNAPVPSWSIAVFTGVAWLIQRAAKRFVRLWAALTLPATVLHEFAHWLVGYCLAAQPVNFSLWPKRVSATSWRLGAVGFTRLRWWNGGAVALAPLLWVLVLTAIFKKAPQLPQLLNLKIACLAGFGIVWLWIAVAPSRSDWALAVENWFSALLFLGLWVFGLSLFWISYRF